jgi:hypothetical protein
VKSEQAAFRETYEEAAYQMGGYILVVEGCWPQLNDLWAVFLNQVLGGQPIARAQETVQ